MNGVNVILVLNMASQLVLREPCSLFLALWIVTVMGSVCCSCCSSAGNGEMLHSFINQEINYALELQHKFYSIKTVRSESEV